MKKLLSLFFILTISSILMAQTGKVFDNLSMQSKLLKMDRKYAIYLPPDYETSQRSYPVLYLLHGAGDDQTGWVQFGEVLNIADAAIKSGSATPMIIVMPDANTGKRGYVNDDDFLYEGNCLVHIAMRKKEIPHEFRIRDGVHSWTYWRASLPNVLEFVSMAFHQF